MASRNPIAGGFLIAVAIFAGLVWGFAAGDPIKGLVIGTAVGIAAALVTWLVDRARR